MVHSLYSGWYPRRRWEQKRWPLLLAQVQHQVLLWWGQSGAQTGEEGGNGDKLTEESGGRNETQLARLQSKIRWAIRWGCAGGREGRKVTRAQTPTKSIEDSTRHRSGVPDRASSSVTLCSSSGNGSVFIQGARATFTCFAPLPPKPNRIERAIIGKRNNRCSWSRATRQPAESNHFWNRELPADQRGTAFPRSQPDSHFSPVNRAVALLFSLRGVQVSFVVPRWRWKTFRKLSKTMISPGMIVLS